MFAKHSYHRYTITITSIINSIITTVVSATSMIAVIIITSACAPLRVKPPRAAPPRVALLRHPWAVPFIPMPMPGPVCRICLNDKWVQYEFCRTFLRGGVGMNITAQSFWNVYGADKEGGTKESLQIFFFWRRPVGTPANFVRLNMPGHTFSPIRHPSERFMAPTRKMARRRQRLFGTLFPQTCQRIPFKKAKKHITCI